MEKLNHVLLETVKQGFVPMAGGGAEPVAGASDMTAAMVAPPMGGMPMDPAAAGGGMPMDPSMMGAPPVDPSAGGGAPPMDPSMVGGAPADAAAGGPPPALEPSVISLTVPEFIELIRVIRGDKATGEAVVGGEKEKPQGGEQSKKPRASTADVSAKLDQILAAVSGGGMPPPSMPSPVG